MEKMKDMDMGKHASAVGKLAGDNKEALIAGAAIGCFGAMCACICSKCCCKKDKKKNNNVKPIA